MPKIVHYYNPEKREEYERERRKQYMRNYKEKKQKEKNNVKNLFLNTYATCVSIDETIFEINKILLDMEIAIREKL